MSRENSRGRTFLRSQSLRADGSPSWLLAQPVTWSFSQSLPAGAPVEEVSPKSLPRGAGLQNVPFTFTSPPIKRAEYSSLADWDKFDDNTAIVNRERRVQSMQMDASPMTKTEGKKPARLSKVPTVKEEQPVVKSKKSSNMNIKVPSNAMVPPAGKRRRVSRPLPSIAPKPDY